MADYALAFGKGSLKTLSEIMTYFFYSLLIAVRGYGVFWVMGLSIFTSFYCVFIYILASWIGIGSFF
jgi:hypothetical protein